MTKVLWTPTRNTEREAQRKHGDVWDLRKAEAFQGHASLLIESEDGMDLRWVKVEQANLLT